VRCWSYGQGEWIDYWHVDLPARIDALLCLDSLLVAGCSDNTIRLIDATSGTVRLELTGHRGSVTVLAPADAQGFLSAGFDTTVRHWQRQATQPE
jgi:WD40 repeat protein